MQEYHICHICGERMYPMLESKKYSVNGIQVAVDDVHMFRCTNCGEGVLESEEVKRIEQVVLAQSAKVASDTSKED